MLTGANVVACVISPFHAQPIAAVPTDPVEKHLVSSVLVTFLFPISGM